jgi:flagellar FliL protein
MRVTSLGLRRFPFGLSCGLRIAFPKLMADAQPMEGKKTLKKTATRRRPVAALALPVILGAIGIWYWTSRSADSSAEGNAGPRVRSTLHLETFVLNLADADQRSYLRVGIDLGLSREAKAGTEPDAAPLGEVRDTILGVLAEAKVEALLTTEGKTRLKENILRALQQRAPELGVIEVYFTEFLIQR